MSESRPDGAPEGDRTSTDPDHDPEGAILAQDTAPEELSATQKVENPINDEDSDEQIVEKLKAQGVRIGAGLVSPAVFWPSLILISVVAILTIVFPGPAGDVLSASQGWIVGNLGWLYMGAIAIFIVFSVAVCFSRYGSIRLGRDDERPEFSTLSWFAMLFAAGMGVGLVFYGVSEPVGYVTSEVKPGWEGSDSAIAQLGMAQSYVHWGLHPWAAYAVIGLALAYAIHRRGRPVSVRWALEPLLGERVKGWIGDVIDILAIFGTMFGIATSLGLGAQQIAAGLEAMGVVGSSGDGLLIVLIIIITVLAIASLVSGLGAGIKWLSNINLSLAGVLLIAVLLLGPTIFLLQNFIQSIGSYLTNVFSMTFDAAAFSGQAGADWASTWTLFYWGWWIAWAPFVGVFIARISKGRTVREFVAGVLLVPTLVGFFWFAVMGGLGLFRQLFTDNPLVAEGEEIAAEASLFNALDGLPLGPILSVIAIIVIAIFFITSSDSGSLVIDMLASGGHPNPPIWSRVLFAVLEGAIAIGLLLSGGLTSLQAASLMTALPFSIVLLAMCVATLRSLRSDQAERDREELRARYELFSERLSEDFDDAFGPHVDTRVDHRIDYALTRTRGVFDRGGVRGDRGRRSDSGSSNPSPSAE